MQISHLTSPSLQYSFRSRAQVADYFGRDNKIRRGLGNVRSCRPTEIYTGLQI